MCFSGLLLGQVWGQQCLLRVFTAATSLMLNVTFFSGMAHIPWLGRGAGTTLELGATSNKGDDAPGPGGLAYMKTSTDFKNPSCVYLGK